MAYKAVLNDNTYLCHFNGIHLPKGHPNGGQFGRGDGDGDGIINDHAHRGKGDQNYKGNNNNNKTSEKLFNYSGNEFDISTMSDQELRNLINRKRLEKEFYDSINPRNEEDGRKYYNDQLDTYIKTGKTALTVLQIVKAAKELKKVTT